MGRGHDKPMTLRRRLPYLLLAPSVIVLLALILYPLAFALRNSFWFWNLQTSPQPLYHSGLDNYRMVFQVTPFGVALKNTLLLGFCGAFAQVLARHGHRAAAAYASSRHGLDAGAADHADDSGAGRGRLSLPLPAGAQGRHSALAAGWRRLSRAAARLPGNANTALFSIGLVDTWQWTPFFAIVLYAGLLSINEEIKEAAQVDGASGWRMFWSITLPLLRPIAAFLVMIRFMQLFNSFDLVYVLTSGGPGAASRTLSFNLYREGLVNYNIGLTAAMTWIVVIIVSVIINLYLIFVYRKREW